jgi:hypothetical protein
MAATGGTITLQNVPATLTVGGGQWSAAGGAAILPDRVSFTGSITSGIVSVFGGYITPMPSQYTRGKQILRDVKIRIAGHDVLTYGRTVKIEFEREKLDVTTWANMSNFYQEYAQGREAMACEFVCYIGDSTLDQTLRSQQIVNVQVAPHQADAAVWNPTWSGDCMIVQYTPLTGGLDEPGESVISLASVGAFATQP